LLNAVQPRRGAAGFTVIETMIAVAIAAILVVLGVPVMRGVVENTRIRTAADSFAYGLTIARNEAVRRNAQVQLCVTLTQGTNVTTGWYVRGASANACSYATDSGNGVILHAGTGKEGAGDLAITVTPNGANQITYNSFGMAMATNLDGSAAMTQLDFASATPSGISGYRPLSLQMQAGGLARVCDPAAASTDPRACL
jgi:type IV fimbrial biogenesis protein FimT